ncbi:MAG: nuclear transport factor 2 family protein [Parachlamydiales bacterium]|jgi:ketosteroid isomerase-like protein
MSNPTAKSVFYFAVCFISFLSQLLADPQIEIVERLNKWPKAFNQRNIRDVCGLFASDLVAVYPGTADRNYAEMCSHLSKILNDPSKDFQYQEPEIEQVILSEDVAIVRLIWTLNISEKGKVGAIQIKEKGLDVFKKQPDGSWKISISYAYPLE